MNKECINIEKHPMFSFSKEIEFFTTSSIKELGVDHIDYVKAYKNGSRIHLMSNLNFMSHYYKNNLFQSEALYNYTGEFVFICPLNIEQYFNNPLKNNCEKSIYLHLKKYFNAEYWLAFPAHHKDYYSVYFFCAYKDKVDIVNSFARNIDLFKSYIKNFNESGKKIITDAEKNLIITSKAKTTLKNSDFQLDSSYNITSRESTCLNFLLCGLSAKEIANELEISYRTVEKYIASLKSKLHCSTTSQLISLIYRKYNTNFCEKI